MKAVALVTGVTGMVGARVAGDLSEGGHHVFGLARRAPDTVAPGQDAPWTHITCDLQNPARVAAVLRFCQPSVIVHAAAAQASAVAGASHAELYATNVEGTLNLLEAVRQMAPGARVVFVGTGACYGPAQTRRRRWTEQDPLHPVSFYAASKAAADLAAQAYAEIYRLDVVVARLFNLFGPTRGSDSAPAWFARQLAEMEAGLRERVITCGNLSAVRDFLDYGDASAGLCRLCFAPLSQRVYNLCSGRGLSVGALLRRLAKHSTVRRYRLSPPEGGARDRLVGNSAPLMRDTGWRPVVSLDQSSVNLLQFWRERVRARNVPCSQ